MCKCGEDGKKCLGCQLLGSLVSIAAVAGGAYFLFKTKKGEEVRKKAKEWGEEAKEKVTSTVEDLSEKSRELIDKAEDLKNELKEKADELTGERKAELEEKLERIKQNASELWKEVEGFSGDVKRAAEKRFTEKKKTK
jgi:gas vesicle protein